MSDAAPPLSIVIPAYNEEALIGTTLDAARQALRDAGLETAELIVADDDSDDRTAEIARERGALVVPTKNRQIAATRNAGGHAARGDRLLFLDADTVLPGETLRAAMRAMDEGAVGGGVRLQFDRKPGVVMRGVVWAIESILRTFRFAPGCCIFIQRDVFQAVGGFDESLYASEEIAFSRAVKRHGRFVMLNESVITSGRKMDYHSTGQLLWMMLKMGLKGPRSVKTRKGLDVWYDGQRG